MLFESPQNSGNTTNLLAKIPHGDGQTILREALLAADHTGYHSANWSCCDGCSGLGSRSVLRA